MQAPISAIIGSEIFANIRDDEVIQAICEHHIDKLTLGPRRPGELERRQKEDSKVEGHTIDKCRREKPTVCRRNDTTLVRDPRCGQQDTVKQQRPVSETDCNQCNDNVPFLSPDGHSVDKNKRNLDN
jgi:hypothetical protein